MATGRGHKLLGLRLRRGGCCMAWTPSACSRKITRRWSSCSSASRAQASGPTSRSATSSTASSRSLRHAGRGAAVLPGGAGHGARHFEHVTLESLEEHNIVAVLSDLDSMSPEDERFDAKVTVLIENAPPRRGGGERALQGARRCSAKQPSAIWSTPWPRPRRPPRPTRIPARPTRPPAHRRGRRRRRGRPHRRHGERGWPRWRKSASSPTSSPPPQEAAHVAAGIEGGP